MVPERELGGGYKLPPSAAIRRSIGAAEGDDVTIHVTQRRNLPPAGR
jgi:hypothetical protein